MAKKKAGTAKKASTASVTEAMLAASLNDKEKDRSCTGVLATHRDSRDIKIEQVSMSAHSKVLITESTIELNFGNRYGLLGHNGCGKSTFLEALANREFPIPEHIDIYLLNKEYPATDLTALQAVINEAEKEVKRLEKEMERILEEDPESPLMDDYAERIDELDPHTFEARASAILRGLGFTHTQMSKSTKDLSGGWRMRVALARALFVKPTLLLLDQPTNHLDLGACVWLEEYLKKYDRILLLISHSQDFLNNVCTDIIDWDPLKKILIYYGGNYDTYVNTRMDLEVNQMKRYEKQQDDIKHIKKFIASAGTYSNLVRQAKSKQKIIDKMEADGLVEKVVQRSNFAFSFEPCQKLPPPVLCLQDVSFAYSGKKEDMLYEHLELGVDCDSRVALVGPNGAGKSTLLKLMIGDLMPSGGQVSRHSHLKICRYSQHSADQLDLDKSAVDYLRDKFGDVMGTKELQYWRSQVGKFGLIGESQLCPMRQLSDGQRSRAVFCELALSMPNMILFDEPTNALDIETIDSLADAINVYEGGVVLVSHDFRLISQVAQEIWLCEDKKVTRWTGTIQEYKERLRKQVMEE
ncbi:ABC-like elongation factor 3 [Acrasis kona]|uniref:ABC transporter protein ARB1 n=1 Tax=Acrasis kona TaxID=1008807 RepID=A0AAW2YMA9_9EUKA